MANYTTNIPSLSGAHTTGKPQHIVAQPSIYTISSILGVTDASANPEVFCPIVSCLGNVVMEITQAEAVPANADEVDFFITMVGGDKADGTLALVGSARDLITGGTIANLNTLGNKYRLSLSECVDDINNNLYHIAYPGFSISFDDHGAGDMTATFTFRFIVT